MSLRQKLMRKPWEDDPDAFIDADGSEPVDEKTIRTALKVFLAIVTVLFFLLSVAYNMRMDMPDWQSFSEPRLLWFNTALLILGGAALELARAAARNKNASGIKSGLLVAGAMTFGFLIGQFLAWQQLVSAGFFAEANPSYAFFYLITGLHGLHILGGLFVWSRATARFAKGEDIEQVRVSVDLCAIYWHYLSLVWIALFAMLLIT